MSLFCTTKELYTHSDLSQLLTLQLIIKRGQHTSRHTLGGSWTDDNIKGQGLQKINNDYIDR